MSNSLKSLSPAPDALFAHSQYHRSGFRATLILAAFISVGLFTGCGKTKPQTDNETTGPADSESLDDAGTSSKSATVEKSATVTAPETGDASPVPDATPSGETNPEGSAGVTTTPAAAPVSRRVAGDPQLMTDHLWYPGELSCSTFETLFKTQAALYTRVTGRSVESDEDKAIASWYWRNLNYYHMMSPVENYWDLPVEKITDYGNVVRDYWSGLFGYGFGLCGMTHFQWTAEHEYLFGHCRGRVVGVAGHNSYEVFLTGEQYGPDGDWALLDHDISTIVFDDPADPKRLRSLWDITYETRPPEKKRRAAEDLESILDNENAPDANQGWFISGLYFTNKDNSNAEVSDAIGVYTDVNQTEILSGYAGVEPMVSIKRGETIRRYLRPGLGEQTYVWWGSNMPDDKLPGPSRGRTWCNQPEKMYRAVEDTPWVIANYGNAVYTYAPDFKTSSYRDGVIEEDNESVTFYFYSPYPVAATPAADLMQVREGVFKPGCTNGLVISGKDCKVQISTDNGAIWSDAVDLSASLDLTDIAKGHHSYHLKFLSPATALADKGIVIRTVCMLNDRLVPHLKDGGSTVTYQASGKAVFAAGPNCDQAQRYITDGGFKKNNITMTIPVAFDAKPLKIQAAAWIASGAPPKPDIAYSIEGSTDNGLTWFAIVKDWKAVMHGYQATDWWSQSFVYGGADIPDPSAKQVMVRFTNNGGRTYRKAEAYLIYETQDSPDVEVTFQWSDGEKDVRETKTATKTYSGQSNAADSSWTVETGTNVITDWVEMRAE